MYTSEASVMYSSEASVMYSSEASVMFATVVRQPVVLIKPSREVFWGRKNIYISIVSVLDIKYVGS